MGLNAFLSQNVGKIKKVEHVVSNRFTDGEGKPVPFVLAPITADVDEDIRNQSTKQVTGKGGRPEFKIDSSGYSRKMTVATIIEPNLNDQALQDSYGVMGAEKLLTKMLLPGEYAKLIQKVQEVNGFKTFEDLEDDVKNE